MGYRTCEYLLGGGVGLGCLGLVRMMMVRASESKVGLIEARWWDY